MKTNTNKYISSKIFKNHDLYVWLGLLLSLILIIINILGATNKLLNENNRKINSNNLNYDQVVTFEDITKPSNIKQISKKYAFDYDLVTQKLSTQTYFDHKLSVEYQIFNQKQKLPNQKFLITNGRNIKGNNETIILEHTLNKLHLYIGDYLNINGNYLKIVGTYVTPQTIEKQTQNLNEENRLVSPIIVNDFTFKQIPAQIQNQTYLKFKNNLNYEQQEQIFKNLFNDHEFAIWDKISLFKYQTKKINYNEDFLCDNKTKVADMRKWGQMTQSDFTSLQDILSNKHDLNNCLEHDNYLPLTKKALKDIELTISVVNDYLKNKQNNAKLENVDNLSLKTLLKQLINEQKLSNMVLTFKKDDKIESISEKLNNEYLTLIDGKLVLNLSKINDIYSNEMSKLQGLEVKANSTFNATIRIPNGSEIKYFSLLKRYQKFNKTMSSNVLLQETKFLTTFGNAIIAMLGMLVVIMLILIINKVISENSNQLYLFKKIGISNFTIIKPFALIIMLISGYYVIWALLIKDYLVKTFMWYLQSKYNLVNTNLSLQNFGNDFWLFLLVIIIVVSIILSCLISTKLKNITFKPQIKIKSKPKLKLNIIHNLIKNKFLTFSTAVLVSIITFFVTIIVVCFVNLNLNFSQTNDIVNYPILNEFSSKENNVNAYKTSYNINEIYDQNGTKTNEFKNDIKSLQVIGFTNEKQTNLNFRALLNGLILPRSYANKYNLKVNDLIEINTSTGLKKLKISSFSNKLNDRYLYTSQSYLEKVFLAKLTLNASLQFAISKHATNVINFKNISAQDSKVYVFIISSLSIMLLLILIIINPVLKILKDLILIKKLKAIKTLKIIGLPTSKIIKYIFTPYLVLAVVSSVVTIYLTQMFVTQSIVLLIFQLLGYNITFTNDFGVDIVVFLIIIGIYIIVYILSKINIKKIK